MATTAYLGAQQMARLLAGWDMGAGPLHSLLSRALRDQVASGALAQGTVLPSQRDLARVLAVSRTTVGTAYDALTDEGILASRHGAGTRVRTNRVPGLVEAAGPPAHPDRLGTYVDPELPLDLGSGALPASPLMSRVLRGHWTTELRGRITLDRFLPWGLEEVRTEVAAYFAATGAPTDPSDVLLTNGSHHALSLVAARLVEAGDVVLVEDPTYRGALDVFQRRGARVVGVPVDEEGPDPLALRRAVRRHGARLLYVLPTAHNVTGRTWSPERRARIAEEVGRAGILVVDDASTADLHGAEHPGYIAPLLPPAQSLTLGSLTKLFWSGLRVGWLRGPSPLLQSILAERVTTDLAGSIPSQVLTGACLPLAAEARLHRRDELHAARLAARNLLTAHLPGWNVEEQHGGACLWVDTHVDAAALSARLRRERILLVAGTEFSPGTSWSTHVRLPLGRPEVLRAAVPVIARVIGAGMPPRGDST